jgi:uncharacterized protein YjiS (DUF1127 family)
VILTYFSVILEYILREQQKGKDMVIINAIKALLDTFDKAQRFKSTYEQLSMLTDRQLQDIGMNRSMIASKSMEIAFGETENV